MDTTDNGEKPSDLHVDTDDSKCTLCSPANNTTTSPLSLGNDHLSSHLIHTFRPHLATSSDTEHNSGLESTGVLIHLGTLILDRTSPSSNTEHHFGLESTVDLYRSIGCLTMSEQDATRETSTPPTTILAPPQTTPSLLPGCWKTLPNWGKTCFANSVIQYITPLISRIQKSIPTGPWRDLPIAKLIQTMQHAPDLTTHQDSDTIRRLAEVLATIGESMPRITRTEYLEQGVQESQILAKNGTEADPKDRPNGPRRNQSEEQLRQQPDPKGVQDGTNSQVRDNVNNNRTPKEFTRNQ
eukprot:g83447.t1